MRSAFRNSLTLTFTFTAFAATLACAGCASTSSCNRDDDEATVTDGIVYGNTYISAPNDAKHQGPWAYFPPARTLSFVHGLHGIPYQIEIWLAFRDVGTLAPSTGNLSIRQVTQDDTTIAFKNDTCSTYWAWVVASLPVYTTTTGDAGEAGASATDAAGASGAL